MTNVIVRMAEYEDTQAMLPLLAQLGYPATLAECEKRFQAFSSVTGHGIGVATLSNKIIGWVAWSASPVFISDQIRIRIEGLVIDENYRGQGVGKQLMQFVEDFAQQWRPVMIELTSNLRRAQEGTHAFYQSIGYHNAGDKAKWYASKEV
jgi:GNAT superfamily N-acetyltransferase